MLSKKCIVCHKTFDKPYYTSLKQWSDRKYCSVRCKCSISKGKPIKWLVKANTGSTGHKCHFWKGGRIKRHGYIAIHLDNLSKQEQFIYKSMFWKLGTSYYCYEHRLIVAKLLKRPLDFKEQIHHINSIKTDNNPYNLFLFPSNSEHRKYEGLKNKYKLTSNLQKSILARNE